MTTNNTNDRTNNRNDEDDLFLAAGRLLAAMPPRGPEKFEAPYGCSWCGAIETDGPGNSGPWMTSRADPIWWTLHVLATHLHGLLTQARVSVRFNTCGGANVSLFDAYPEDVELARIALGVQLSCVQPLDVEGVERCAVNFGTDPYGREVTMTWFTSPDFVRLAAELAEAGWPFTPTL